MPHRRVWRTAVAGLIALAMATAPAHATPICVDVGDQYTVRLVSDGFGGSLLTWIDDRHGYDPGLRVQRLLASGATDPAWPLNGRALTAPEPQISPSLVPDGAGGALVTWSAVNQGYRVYVQHVRANGTVDPAWPPNGLALSSAGGFQMPRDICSDGAGGAIVVWEDMRTDPIGPWVKRVYAQHVRANGTVDPVWPANGRAIAPGYEIEDTPCCVSDGARGAVVAWVVTGVGVYAQHVHADGTLDPAWPANGTALASGVLAYFPVMVPDGGGGAIVAWRDERFGYSDVYAQRVRADGARADGWPVEGLPVCAAANGADYVSIASDSAGGAIIAWQDQRSGSDWDVYAQRVLAGGTRAPGWPPDGRVVCAAGNDQLYPAVVSDGAHGAIVSWQDARNNTDYDIYALRVLADGALDPAWPREGRSVCHFADAQYNPQLATDGLGGAFVAWQDLRNGTDWDIYAQRVLGDGAFGGTVGVAGVTRPALSVGPARDNPSRTGRVSLRVTLPAPEPASLEMIDVGGRRIDGRELVAPGPGTHEVDLAVSRDLPAGLYFVRLRQGAAVVTTRISVLR